MAHIGVLKVLEKFGTRIDAIAGTSIGAVIGALYAAGVPVDQMEEVARNVDWRQIARLLDPTLPTSGLIDGRKVSRFLAELLPVRTFEELDIPLAVVATDVETGEMLVIRKGDLLQGLQAAIAFPGIFTPVPFGDRFLVDGGLRNPVPADIVREMGTERVIGVCAIPEVCKTPTEASAPLGPNGEGKERKSRFELFNAARVESILKDILGRDGGDQKKVKNSSPRKPPSLFRVCAQSVIIMENEINQLRLERNEIDLLIRPDLKSIALLDFHRAAEAIRAGEAAAAHAAYRLDELMSGR